LPKTKLKEGCHARNIIDSNPGTRSLPIAQGPESAARDQGTLQGSKGDEGEQRRKALAALHIHGADEAKSPQQFASLLNGGTATTAAQAGGSWGAITELTVQYTKEGYTIITVRYEKGNMPLIVVYPTT
jgi:hypothetical protein